MKLTVRERERGWVIHSCRVHGPLVACTPRADVFCGDKISPGKRCNARCVITVNGVEVSRQEKARLRRPQSPCK